MKKFPKKVLVLGSGAIKIGEAGEFDYSGSQALKALREDSVKTVLVNPNIATIQTSRDMADEIYFLPVEPEFVAKVIAKEGPDGAMIGFGGQTALNCGVRLHKKGIFKKYGVKVLGTPIETIIKTEDRNLFKKAVADVGLAIPKSVAVKNVDEAREAARKIGYPLILRAAYSLGGLGSSVVRNKSELESAIKKSLRFSPQVLLEEYLEGWKELEYEVVRDRKDNCIVVCNMENIDPMGIHTGESIVVAPSQTLSNQDYHLLRSRAISLVRSLGVVGECNVQFALDPKSNAYRVIEMNARLSRSSALASKATGYPLAYIAAKLALGYKLTDLKNSVTKVTTACFEPALDYVTVKMPRWDLKKFKNVSKKIGSEMKSVGEVMAIGRNFEEALQKAIRMLNIGATGLCPNKNFAFRNLAQELKEATDERIFAIAAALEKGWPAKKIFWMTRIDKWFIYKMKNIVDAAKTIKKNGFGRNALLFAKQKGFSDGQIADILESTEEAVRKKRENFKIEPAVKRVDTLAAEYPALTNYLYTTYGSSVDEHGVGEKKSKGIMILGSGPYKIGSSVEFDWCCVNTARVCRRLGYTTIMVNCNPETVSTDYDECDKLYFEELTAERVIDIWRKEKPLGVIVSVGGQIPNNLALSLERAGVKILGTSAASIHRAEDRFEFSRLLDLLGVDQPKWKELSSLESIKSFAREVGYPVLVRPSYVLSGAAMGVAFTDKELDALLRKALAEVNNAHPVVVSKFITGAKELEIDAVANKGKLITWAVSEHVENAGVHSGDATIIFPTQKVYKETEEKVLKIARDVAKALKVSGPFNIQFLAKDNNVMVIECNLRASRSFPFVSKVSGVNFIEVATCSLLGMPVKTTRYKRPSFVGVKAPQFSFSRLRGSDPVLTVDMTSTGEVACFGESIEEAFLKSILAAGFKLPKNNVLLSLGGDENKAEFLESALKFQEMGFEMYTTLRTTEFFEKHGLKTKTLYKPLDKKNPSVLESLKGGSIDLLINTSDEEFPENIPDDYIMRRTAVDFNVPLITNIKLAKLLVASISKLKSREVHLAVEPWSWYLENRS